MAHQAGVATSRRSFAGAQDDSSINDKTGQYIYMSDLGSILSPATRQEIDRWLTKYPPERKRSAVLTALRLAQDQNGGWLTIELMDAVAFYLDLPKIAVYEVASFYTLLQTQPIGRHKISVCNSISCMLNGSEKILAHLENRLGVKVGETSVDGMFTVKEVECLAACVGAPMLQIDNQQYHEYLTPERVDQLLEEIKQQEMGHGK